ncbi:MULTISPECIES: tetratricopeptide repeat protein [Sphingobacterium]|uniref:tetratricopeptide repeat protein n=1 Tax=Sphingobacterium TaxID=28453 RepID=UPI001404436A|nr:MULTISPECIES: tetratricopeptide repeat protein [Sphingobacterium]MCW2263034.1 tetratricopeptide (TPR) repeat protein [Sphingobacterium kitahiroshimense]
MRKQLLFFILLLFTFKAIAGDDKKQEIDSLLAKSMEFASRGDLVTYIETAIKALNLANVANYDEGKAKSGSYIAEGLVTVGLFKEGLKQLDRIEATDFYKNETFMQSEVHRLRGRAYGGLMLHQQAIREFRLQQEVIKRLTGEIKVKSYQFNYENLSAAFRRMGQLDSMQKYTELQLENLKVFEEKDAAMRYQIVYENLGSLYVQKGDLVKAQQYLDKSLELMKKYKIPVVLNTYGALGLLEKQRKNFKKAAAFYEESLVKKRAAGSRIGMKNSYRELADFYRTNNLDKAKADHYEMAFSRLNDSLENENRQVVDQVLNQILKLKDQESDAKVSKSVTISIIALVVLTIAVTFFVRRSRHNRKVLGQKEEALQETETINKELTEQIGENKFNNLNELAKSNNPEFLTLFTELYPEFIQALKSRDSNLRSTELEFCAMAFLNFSTKNIAEYTFVTVRAVQVRKNRLRKKFEIPSDADFNNWMRGLAEKVY